MQESGPYLAAVQIDCLFVCLFHSCVHGWEQGASRPSDIGAVGCFPPAPLGIQLPANTPRKGTDDGLLHGPLPPM